MYIRQTKILAILQVALKKSSKVPLVINYARLSLSRPWASLGQTLPCATLRQNGLLFVKQDAKQSTGKRWMYSRLTRSATTAATVHVCGFRSADFPNSLVHSSASSMKYWCCSKDNNQQLSTSRNTSAWQRKELSFGWEWITEYALNLPWCFFLRPSDAGTPHSLTMRYQLTPTRYQEALQFAAYESATALSGFSSIATEHNFGEAPFFRDAGRTDPYDSFCLLAQ